jgi:hypothetical protein
MIDVTRRASVLVSAGVALVTGIASAEQEIYVDSAGTTKLLFGINVIGSVYRSEDPWFGASASFLGADTTRWTDVGFEPSLALELPAGKGTFFGEVSGVYTGTYEDDASGLTVGLDDTEELTLEQGHVGWRAEDVSSRFENETVSLTFGRQDYSIGTGLLINDGGGDGGERGGWYLGMRKAFSESLVFSLDSDTWLLEGFKLKNRPRAGGTQGDAYGANVEYAFEGGVTLGGTYMQADSNVPGSDKLDVLSARLDWQVTDVMGVGGEYVDESSSQIGATGYYGEIRYTPQNVSWMPEFSYRYAHFDGDDPTTAEDERFREIAYGFTDYGYWYQGEITGGYALGNGNIVSHMFRLKATPRENVTANVFLYKFSLDQPGGLDPSVTSDDWGDEINFTLDWEASENFYIIGVLGLLSPGAGAAQWVGGDQSWIHAMFYVSYTW